MVSLESGSKEFLVNGPQADFWRPPTDNDYGNGMDNRLSVWKDAGERATIKKVNISQPESGTVLVNF